MGKKSLPVFHSESKEIFRSDYMIDNFKGHTQSNTINMVEGKLILQNCR